MRTTEESLKTKLSTPSELQGARLNSEWVDVILSTPYGDETFEIEEDCRLRILEYAIARGLIRNIDI